MTTSADLDLSVIAEYLGRGSTGPADPDLEPVVIGWVTASSGPFGQPDVDTAMTTAVRALNDRLGGVGGRRLVVRRFLVDGSDAQVKDAAEQLLADPSVSLVLEGNLPTGAGLLHEALGDRLAVAVVSAIGPADEDAAHAYCLTPGTAGAVRAFGHYLTEVLDVRDVSIVRVAFDRTSDPIEADVRSALESKGGVARVGYFGALDRSPKGWFEQSGVERALADAGAASADVIVLLGVPHPDPVIHCARALEELDLGAPVLAIGFGLTEEVRVELGDFPRWTYMRPDPLIGAPDPSGHVGAYCAILEEYLPGVDPASLFLTSMAAFGSVVTLAKILAPSAAGTLDRRTAEDALAGYRGPVFLGPTSTPPRDDPAHPAVASRAARWYRYAGKQQWELAADWVDPARLGS